MKGHIPGPRASPGPGPARAGPQPRQAAAPTVPLRALAPSARSQRIFYRVYIARAGRTVFSKAYIAPKTAHFL